jgi:uncharacterized flavoprotein (TIGR03862 family)
VVGGGPAGLRAAEVASRAGFEVVLFDAKPSVGRKFLVAGKGGLNLTHGEGIERFATRYSGPGQPVGIWDRMLEGFGPQALRAWAKDLGEETFQATSGRVYPSSLKAAPLLRRWVQRLRSHGVRFEMNHRLTALRSDASWILEFAGYPPVMAHAVVMALGGGSWSNTGSDGAWLPLLESMGVRCHPLRAANCGWEHEWPADVLKKAEGKPLKNIHVRAGDSQAVGELLITQYGLEGGAIYQLGAVLRSMANPAIAIDFKPSFTTERLIAKMESVRRNFLEEARVRWRLCDGAMAILGRSSWSDTASLAREVKRCVIPLKGTRPIDEAISSAGGVCWEELTEQLMIRRLPGVFVAGEMVDWEAPTGGYLMQGCFASGSCAAQGAIEWLTSKTLSGFRTT